MKTYALAIDIGASSGRHIASWLEDGKICMQEVYRFPNGAEKRNGHLCWDIDALRGHVIAGLRAAHEKGFTPTTIGIDTWGVDYVLLDENDCVLGDAVAYRDDRTEGMDTLLEKALPFHELYAVSGTAKQIFNTVYQMIAVLKEHPEYAEQAKDFLFMPEYLAFCLTGKKAHEWSECSTSALCDARTHTWSETIRHAAGLPDSWFNTPILAPGAALGQLSEEIANELGYQATVILPATHDTGSAYMAVPAKTKAAAFLSSGTWSLLGMELPAPVLTAEAQASGFTNEGGWNYTTRFLKNIMGMWMLQCIHKESGGVMSYAEMAQAAGASDYPAWIDATDVRFLAPENMTEEIKAALADAGAPAPRDLPDILRAVTMGLAVCYRDSINEIGEMTGRKVDSINIVGGGSQNVVLNQMTADLTGLPVYAGPTEGTALGNIAAQMIWHGDFADLPAFRAALALSCDLSEYRPR